jgi:hypothetical protein
MFGNRQAEIEQRAMGDLILAREQRRSEAALGGE